MVSKGEQDVVASQSLVPGIEVTLGHGESMTQMEAAVHVREREGLKVLGFLIRFRLEVPIPLPNLARPPLQGDELVPPCGILLLFLLH